MQLFRTLKRAAGRLAFSEGELIQLGDDDAAALLAAGAVEVVEAEQEQQRPVEESKPEASEEKPKSEAQSIRDELEATPDATNKDIVARLAERGVKVTSGQVTTQRKRLED